MFASRITSLRARLSARLARALALASVGAITLATAACSGDRFTAPVAELGAASNARTGAGGNTTTSTTTTGTTNSQNAVSILRWNTTATDVTVSKVIGVDGGTLSAPGGLVLTVPKGAVPGPTTFSIRRVPGRLVAYEFEPHGRTFAQPLVLTQATAGTNFLSSPIGTAYVRGAYFADNSHLDQQAGKAVVSEFRSATIAKDRSSVRFTVDHFSGYMVSMD